MTEQIIMVRLWDIQPHPLQEKVYGGIYLEPEFLESIKSEGVLTPVILTDSMVYPETELPFICVSGHRRCHAALETGYEEVPAVIRKYENADECNLHFLSLNIQREKNHTQRLNEFFEYKQTLDKLAKYNKLKNLKNIAVYQDDELFKILRALKIKPEEPLDSIQILKDISGFSEWEQRLINEVTSDDWKVKQYVKLRKIGMTVEYEDKLDSKWQEVRIGYWGSTQTLKEAHNKIKKLLDDANAKFTPKAKQEPKKEKKEEKIIQVDAIEPDAEFYEIADKVENWMKEYFSVQDLQYPKWQSHKKILIDFYTNILNNGM